MARLASVKKNLAKQALIEKYKKRREELRKILKDPNASLEEKMQAQFALQKLPKWSCPTQYRNRCYLTGRPRGYYRDFGLGRMALRKLALEGKLPGVVKASW